MRRSFRRIKKDTLRKKNQYGDLVTHSGENPIYLLLRLSSQYVGIRGVLKYVWVEASPIHDWGRLNPDISQRMNAPRDKKCKVFNERERARNKIV